MSKRKAKEIEYREDMEEQENILPSVPFDPEAKIQSIQEKILQKMEDKVDSEDDIPLKDLRETYVSLLEVKGGSRGGSSDMSEAARGAVFGALQGLASLSGAKFDSNMKLEEEKK